jgi:hypothetical protein
VSTTEQAAAPKLPDIEPMPVAVTFASRGIHLTLERVHPRRHVDASGNAVWQKGVDYEFEEGRLVVYPGQDRIADKFDAATGEMHEQDAIEWLRAQPMYGHGNGFWEVAPIAPDPAPVMQAIMQIAVAAGNPETRDEAESRLVRSTSGRPARGSVRRCSTRRRRRWPRSSRSRSSPSRRTRHPLAPASAT